VLRAAASGVALTLSVTALGVVAAPSAHAASVEIQLLNINDFHGRIDANTTKFATTVENLRAENPNTLLLSAGDNVGASLFASNVQQDAPTIDVLNALGLQVSAVGNHEFDKGAADLTGRISDRASFDYLGANVYNKGTETPALPEYKTFETGGVTVGVIGAVTQETVTAVSPAGIANLDFGDPVAAVNRVAGQLSDGNATNGEADVIVAEYHEGAEGGEPDSSLAAELARNGGDTAFNDIVEDTVPAVDVIFTGHTHSTYAWDAPVPGAGAGVTRPIVQTGSYGANIGQVELTYDTETEAVTAYTKANVARVATANESLPKVAQVKTIVDAALANAAQVGGQVIGKQEGDVTTAFTGGSYVGGRYAGGTRDDRTSESTLGNLVADALLAGASASTPDFAVTNPGGLRAELIAGTDKVITLAEAASVLTFANTLSTVKMTGAQIDTLFEQQWPHSASRTGYLQLGVSDNLRVTADPSRTAGDRITSIRLNGTVLDPAKTYTVSTLTFLAAGGDDFDAFAEGQATDIGLLDLDVFTDYLKKNTPITPEFARQQVNVTDGTLPDTISAGDQVSFDVGNLDLTSQGSPQNTRISAFAVSAGGARKLVTFPVVNGRAQIDFTAPSDLAAGQGLSLVAEPSRTIVGAALPRLDSSTTATIPSKLTFGTKLRVPVRVDAPLDATGNVRLMEGDKVLTRAELVNGQAVLELGGRALQVGAHDLHVTYAGDPEVTWSRSTLGRVQVYKAKVRKLNVAVRPGKLIRRRTFPAVVVSVKPPTGFDKVFGDVKIMAGGRSVTAALKNSKVTVRLRPFTSLGKKTVTVKYLGTKAVARTKQSVTVRVVRR
jgi:5'-nucleotidase